MGTLNKKAYKQLIEEDIAFLEKAVPGRSLEKEHIIEVLEWSIEELYSDQVGDNKECNCTYMTFGEHAYFCPKFVKSEQ